MEHNIVALYLADMLAGTARFVDDVGSDCRGGNPFWERRTRQHWRRRTRRRGLALRAFPPRVCEERSEAHTHYHQRREEKTVHALARIAAPVRVHCYDSAFSGISFQLWCGEKCSPASVCGSALSLVFAGQRSVVCLRLSPVSRLQASATLRACGPCRGAATRPRSRRRHRQVPPLRVLCVSPRRSS